MCVLKDALDYDSPSEVAELIRATDVEAALALHAYRAGRLLRGRRPFVFHGAAPGTLAAERPHCPITHGRSASPVRPGPKGEELSGLPAVLFLPE